MQKLEAGADSRICRQFEYPILYTWNITAVGRARNRNNVGLAKVEALCWLPEFIDVRLVLGVKLSDMRATTSQVPL